MIDHWACILFSNVEQSVWPSLLSAVSIYVKIVGVRISSRAYFQTPILMQKMLKR